MSSEIAQIDFAPETSFRTRPPIRVIRAITPDPKVGKLFLLFLAEFLESGIAAQRVPDRIESKKCWRNRR